MDAVATGPPTCTSIRSNREGTTRLVDALILVNHRSHSRKSAVNYDGGIYCVQAVDLWKDDYQMINISLGKFSWFLRNPRWWSQNRWFKCVSQHIVVDIREEIQEIMDGRMDAKVNPLKMAPHSYAVISSDKWDRPYSREQGAFPAVSFPFFHSLSKWEMKESWRTFAEHLFGYYCVWNVRVSTPFPSLLVLVTSSCGNIERNTKILLYMSLFRLFISSLIYISKDMDHSCNISRSYVKHDFQPNKTGITVFSGRGFTAAFGVSSRLKQMEHGTAVRRIGQFSYWTPRSCVRFQWFFWESIRIWNSCFFSSHLWAERPSSGRLCRGLTIRMAIRTSFAPVLPWPRTSRHSPIPARRRRNSDLL